MSEQWLHSSTGPLVRHAQTVPNVVPSSVTISWTGLHVHSRPFTLKELQYQTDPAWWELVVPMPLSLSIASWSGRADLSFIPCAGHLSEFGDTVLQCLVKT